jgi:hypothetical protein
MAEHGGYRRPEHPAPVSGPGALSRRTDGTQPEMVASGGQYGDRKAMQAIQGGAPMAGPPPGPRPVPFGAPTQRPDEPVTAGADAGPGIGSSAAGINSDTAGSIQQLAPLVSSLELMANLPNSTPESRSFVRYLKAQIASQ